MASKIDFEGMIAKGEAKNAPAGFRSQTVNGTGHHVGLGWNRDTDWPTPPAAEGGAWQPTGNRTSE